MRFQFGLKQLLWLVVAVAVVLGLFRMAHRYPFAGYLAISIWGGLVCCGIFVAEAARQAAQKAFERRLPDKPDDFGIVRAAKRGVAFVWGVLVALVIWIILLAMLGFVIRGFN